MSILNLAIAYFIARSIFSEPVETAEQGHHRTPQDTFSEYVQPSHSVLMLGCGNSRLSEDCWEASKHSQRVLCGSAGSDFPAGDVRGRLPQYHQH